MDDSELARMVRESRQDGFRDSEIRQAMIEDGIPSQQVERVFKMVAGGETGVENSFSSNPVDSFEPDAGNEFGEGFDTGDSGNSPAPGNSSTAKDVLTNVDLTDPEYVVKQHFIRNKYEIYDVDGEKVMGAKQKLFHLKEDIPFRTPDGELAFRVKAQGMVDIAGDYNLEDPDGNPLLMLDRKYTIFTHSWKIRDAETESVVARVKGRNRAVDILRVLGDYVPLVPNIFNYIPHSYDVTDQDDNAVGEIEGKFSIRDTYSVKLDQVSSVPREALLAGIIAIDALEGN